MRSSFIDIITLRPEVRTSVIAALRLRIERLDHPAPIRPPRSQAEAEIAHHFAKPAQAAEVLLVIILAEFHQQ